jgi:uncharacterized protein YaiI (UPF0178 family)
MVMMLKQFVKEKIPVAKMMVKSGFIPVDDPGQFFNLNTIRSFLGKKLISGLDPDF